MTKTDKQLQDTAASFLQCVLYLAKHRLYMSIIQNLPNVTNRSGSVKKNNYILQSSTAISPHTEQREEKCGSKSAASEMNRGIEFLLSSTAGPWDKSGPQKRPIRPTTTFRNKHTNNNVRIQCGIHLNLIEFLSRDISPCDKYSW